MSPNEIATAAQITLNNVNQYLYQMCKSGEVIKVSRGNYVSATRQDLIPPKKSRSSA